MVADMHHFDEEQEQYPYFEPHKREKRDPDPQMFNVGRRNILRDQTILSCRTNAIMRNKMLPCQSLEAYVVMEQMLSCEILSHRVGQNYIMWQKKL